MSERSQAPAWGAVIGYAIGTGLAFVATLGIWLQYGTSTFNAISGGAVSLAIGLVLGGAWALLRRHS